MGLNSSVTKTGLKGSRKSAESYFKWRVERAVPAVDRIQKFIKLKNKKVLDVGCGFGSMIFALSERGADVTGVEINADSLEKARKFLKEEDNIKLLQVDNEDLPFQDNEFDIVTIFDVIEHVRKPEKTIEESFKVLKPGGILYVEFTPYYSITGHHLWDYTKLPIHILPENWIKNVVYSKEIEGFLDQDHFWLQFKSLNKLKISDFRQYTADFEFLEERFIIKYPPYFEVNIPIIKYLGPFKDVFTLSYEAVLRKPKK